jgi:hypothetical protein
MPAPVGSKEALIVAVQEPDIDQVLAQQRARVHEFKFSPWQVENLLNQALDLLERNQRERTAYDDLRARWIEQCANIYAEKQEVAILQSRVAAGTHRLDQITEQEELDIQKLYVNRTPVDGFTGWDETLRVMKVAWHKSVERGDPVGEHAHAAQFYIATSNHRREEKKIIPQERRVALATADAKRFEETVIYLEDVLNNKAAAMNAGGAFNYQERFEALKAQMTADFDDAVLRLEAAYEGMQAFFGYGEAKSEIRLPDDRKLESLATWTRKAVAWMVAFTHQDQAVTSSISLRSVMGKQWDKVIQNLKKEEEQEFTFRWDGGTLKNAYFVRLIGISAYYIGKATDKTLQMKVRLPEHAISRQRTGTVDVEQSLPTCQMGRIRHANSQRPPEIVGTNSLRNASPIGRSGAAGLWTISIASAWPDANASGGIEDIILELQVNVNGNISLPSPLRQ